MIPFKNIYNYFYLFLVIVWSPLQYYVLHFDNLGRTIALFSTLTLLICFFDKKMSICVTNKYTVPWLVWIVVEVFLLFFIKGYHYGEYQKAYLYIFKDILTPLVTMYVACYEAKRDWRQLCKVLIVAYVIYIILAGFDGYSFSMGDRDSNLTVMGNGLPAAMVSLMLLSLMFVVNKIGNRGVLYALVFVALVLIFISGARKSLISALVVLFFAYIALQKKMNITKIIGLSVIILLSFFVVKYLLENSFYADRFEESEELGAAINQTDIKWLSFLGDRTIMYIEGFEFFKENKLTGIGLTNYCYYGSVKQMMHSEYMTQLAECGLIGTALFVLFYYRVLRGLFSKKTMISRENRLIMIGYMMACLFTAFTAWLYTSSGIYMMYGIIIAFITNKNIENESSHCKSQS